MSLCQSDALSYYRRRLCFSRLPAPGMASDVKDPAGSAAIWCIRV